MPVENLVRPAAVEVDLDGDLGLAGLAMDGRGPHDPRYSA